MPLQQGEVALLTLFSDVHTYLSAPTTKPVHHRFDRRSYIYLYHDALNKRGRVEVANHVGTPDQDAFSGYLDAARVEYSFKQPTLFTITIDSRGPTSTPHNDMSQWHIPNFDPKNENKYMYKVHTIDLYLWTPADASLFLDSLKRVLSPTQLIMSDVPQNVHSEHDGSMSPVVQQLENMAFSHPRRNDSVSTTQSFPPPPLNNRTPVNQPLPQSPPPTQQSFAPMAYNPAAPAAPEHRVHREKTPPPIDAENGTGLSQAAHYDHFAGPPTGGFTPQQASYMPGPPMGAPQTPGIHRTNTLPPPPQSPFAQSFAPPPHATPPQDPNAHLYAQQPGTPGLPPGTPGLQRQSTQPYQPGQGAPTTQYASYPSHSAQGGLGSPGLPPTSGYAPLASPGYGPQSTTAYSTGYPYQQNATTHGLHQQLYVPEGATKPVGPAPPPGKFDQRIDKVEKGVGRFLKKLDKKF